MVVGEEAVFEVAVEGDESSDGQRGGRFEGGIDAAFDDQVDDVAGGGGRDDAGDVLEGCCRLGGVAVDVELEVLAGAAAEFVEGGDVDERAAAQDADTVGELLDFGQDV